MALDPQFVRADRTRFTLGGERFTAVGVNCYFLAYCSDPSRRAVLNEALRLGANVIRSWAFLGVAERSAGQVAFQYGDGGAIRIDEGPDGLERLDALIQTAGELGLRLILPLVNYWDDLGGMRLYLRWLGIDGGVEEFYRSAMARAAYRDWVEAILTRRNSLTGRLYADEPAIFAWELANEPRCEIPGGRDLLLDWIGEMARFVKSLDSNHLLATGDEGYFRRDGARDSLYDGSHGVDCEAILNFGEIDFGGYHFYPDSMSHSVDFVETWITDHQGAGERAGKPMLFEEYGAAVTDRNDCYARWLESAERLGAAGDLLWMLGGSAPDTQGFRDQYTILSAEEVPAVAAHARRMTARAQTNRE